MIQRGSVYFGNLGENGEGIQSGVRPLLVVQNDIGNAHSRTVIVAPITSRRKKNLPTHFTINLDKKSTVLCEQLTVVHKSQLFDKIYDLTPSELAELDLALMVSLGIRQKEEQ